MSSGEKFMNTGTTKREVEVASLLNKKIPGNIVEGVRFSPWLGSGPNVRGARLYVSVDLFGGRAIRGGYVGDEMNAKQQAEAIYQTIAAAFSY